ASGLLCVVNLVNTWPFFFSSRRRHTRFSRDWSSDVCSSDLVILLVRTPAVILPLTFRAVRPISINGSTEINRPASATGRSIADRSEERRVGKERRERG